MKTFSEFILEARGEHAEEIAKLRRQAQEAMKKGDMDRYAEIAQDIKELQSAEKVEREVNTDAPVHRSAKKGPSSYGGSPQKPRDVESRVGTTSDVQRTDLPSEPGVLTQNRYTKPGTAGGRGTNIGRSGGRYGTSGRP